MSETNVATPADPVYLVWSSLCEQGFDAAQQCAVALVHAGVTPQIHADLCASAGHFEQAYHSATLTGGIHQWRPLRAARAVCRCAGQAGRRETLQRARSRGATGGDDN